MAEEVTSLGRFTDSVTCSKAMSWMYHESFVFERSRASLFMSFDARESWIALHFGRRVKVLQYELMCPVAAHKAGYMRSWALFGTNEQGEWEILDERRCVDVLGSEDDEPVMFKCFCEHWVRDVKLVQTDCNSAQTHIMAVCFFDVIGVPE